MKPSSPTRKPRGCGGERRAEILTAAEHIFVRDGYEGATVRKIAEEVGVSATTLYMHFPDKRAILLEIGGRAIERLLSDSEAIAAQPVGADVRVQAIMHAHMRFALRNPTVYQLIFNEAPREFANRASSTRVPATGYYKAFANVVAELAKAGRLRGKSVHLVVQTLFAGCHGVVIGLITNPNFGYVEADELMTLMVDGLTRGIIDPATA